MLNLRYILRLVSAFLARFKVLIIAGVLIGVLFFFLLKFLIPVLSTSSTLKVGLTGRFTTSTLSNNILEIISKGLTKIDAGGNVEPDIASSWETTDKGKTWIFKINDGIFWQDGKKVTSSTISYAFSDVTISYPDENTIEFKLQNAYSAFPTVVSKPTFKKGLMGVGDWQVKNLSMSGNYVEQITLQDKTGKKIIYKFYPTEERTKLAFEMGEVDTLEDIMDPSPFTDWSRVKITKNINTGLYVAVFFNTQDKLLAEKNIRQALSYAIDKNKLDGKRAISPISIDSWAYNSQVKPYTYDPKKAKEMIDEYKTSSKIENLEISLSIPPILLSQGEMIAKDWEAAGVKVNLHVMSGLPTEYQSLLAIYDIPEDPDQYSIWHSTQTSTNITKYQNPRIDKLLEDGRSQIDLTERKKTYLDFQRFLVEDSPAVFLYYPASYIISRR